MIYIAIVRSGSVQPDMYDSGGWFVDLRLWIQRPAMLLWLRRLIVRAAPTCSLWEHSFNEDALRFRFNRRWVITGMEQIECR